MTGVLGGNAWDWILIFMLLTFAVATGVKDNGNPVVPKPIVVRSLVMIVLVTSIVNINKVITLFTGW